MTRAQDEKRLSIVHKSGLYPKCAGLQGPVYLCQETSSLLSFFRWIMVLSIQNTHFCVFVRSHRGSLKA